MTNSSIKTGILILFVGLVIPIAGNVVAKPDKDGHLPPGLEKRSSQGKPLPPGWQKKLKIGERLDKEIYDRGVIISHKDDLVTIRVEGKLIRLMQNTREIVEILNDL